MNAPRIHTALTAGCREASVDLDRARTPAAIGPDHLTTLGFVSQLLAGGAYALASHDARMLWLVNVFLFLNWLGDSLDGTLARVRNQQRPRYGFYVDHMADTFGALALMAGLGSRAMCTGRSRLGCWRAITFSRSRATWQLIRSGAFICRTGFLARPRFESCWSQVTPSLVTHPYANIAGRSFLLFDVGGAVALAGMAVMAVAAAVRHTVALYREETL